MLKCKNFFYLENEMVKIQFKSTLIRNFKEEDINKNFLDALNNKKLNKFISTKKKKQTYKEALKYLQNMNKNKYFYLIVFNTLKKELVGTITFRKISNNSYYLGFMVCNINYIGGNFFYTSVKKTISYIKKKFNGEKVYAGTAKTNLPSSFFLRKLGFNVIEKNKKKFKFLKMNNDRLQSNN